MLPVSEERPTRRGAAHFFGVSFFTENRPSPRGVRT
jgi:hypothetical protein